MFRTFIVVLTFNVFHLGFFFGTCQGLIHATMHHVAIKISALSLFDRVRMYVFYLSQKIHLNFVYGQ